MKGLVKIGISVVVVVLILEIGLRLSGRLKTYSEKSFGVYQSPYAINANSHIYKENPFDTINTTAVEFSYSYIMNDYGLNDKHNLDALNKETTYLYLGDSFTFGAGTPQDSSVPALLTKMNSCTFINAGFSGSDPFFEAKLIDSIFQPLGFSKYIIMVNVSDLYDYIFRGGNERFLPNGKLQFNKAPWWEKLHQHSYIIRAFAHGILKMDFSLLSPKETKKRKEKAINEYTKLFKNLNDNLQSNLIVIVQPYARQYANSNQVLNEVMNFNYLLDLNKSLKFNNIKTINLNDSLSKTINESNYIDYSWEIDGHYNSKGYLLLSQIITSELKNMNICQSDTTTAY